MTGIIENLECVNDALLLKFTFIWFSYVDYGKLIIDRAHHQKH